MTQAILTAVLAALGELAGLAGSAGSIAKVIEAMTALLPVVVKEYQDLAPVVTSTIDALRNNGQITHEQLQQLDDLETGYDSGFDAAAAAALAEDAAASKA